MHSAILSVAPQAPPFAHAVWLGGAGLSICGVFIVQYLPIKAFSFTDDEIRKVVQQGNRYVSTALLAAGVASPVIIALWASILFALGMFDYMIRSEIGGKKYRVMALLPLGFGVAAVIATMAIGERLSRRVKASHEQPTGVSNSGRPPSAQDIDIHNHLEDFKRLSGIQFNTDEKAFALKENDVTFDLISDVPDSVLQELTGLTIGGVIKLKKFCKKHEEGLETVCEG